MSRRVYCNSNDSGLAGTGTYFSMASASVPSLSFSINAIGTFASLHAVDSPTGISNGNRKYFFLSLF